MIWNYFTKIFRRPTREDRIRALVDGMSPAEKQQVIEKVTTRIKEVRSLIAEIEIPNDSGPDPEAVSYDLDPATPASSLPDTADYRPSWIDAAREVADGGLTSADGGLTSADGGSR